MSVGSSFAGSNRVVGYYPEWGTGRIGISQLRYDKLDHIIYFSISPNADGSLDLGSINLSNLQTLATTAHSNEVGVSICVGGWERGRHFSAMTADTVARANFIHNMHQLCIDYNLDGVDLDWEPVSGSTNKRNYTKLIRELKTALSDDGLLVTVAVASFGSEFEPSAIPYLDWVNIMAYDMGTPHSSYSSALTTLSHWENFGFARGKEFLGVPFYGKSSGGTYTYKEIMDTYAPAPDVDLVNGINFNGIDTIAAKAKYASINGYAGIMIWEISQDTSDETSLLTAIGEGLNISQDDENYRMIPPADLKATASSSHSWYPDPQVVVDGRGMVSETAHSSTSGSWFTTEDDPDRWIVVGLGQTYTLQEVLIWNANEEWGWNVLGFNQTAVYVANMVNPGNPIDNPENWTLVTTQVLLQAPGSPGYKWPETVDLLGSTANYVALHCVQPTDHYGDKRAGLSELRFFTVALIADLDDDNDVDIFDLLILADEWLATDESLRADFNDDGEVDIADLSILAGEWLIGID